MMMGTYPLASKTAEFITNFDKHAKSLVKYMCQVDIIEEEPEAAGKYYEQLLMKHQKNSL